MFKVGEIAVCANIEQVMPHLRGTECTVLEVTSRVHPEDVKLPPFDYLVACIDGRDYFCFGWQLRKLVPLEEKSVAEQEILSLFKVREAADVC